LKSKRKTKMTPGGDWDYKMEVTGLYNLRITARPGLWALSQVPREEVAAQAMSEKGKQ
jgi:hypothetical protein